jgi:hypothetical protein
MYTKYKVMKKTSLLLAYLLLFALSISTNAQSVKYEQISIQLTKADSPNSPASLSTSEAVNLTRLFMQQKGVQRCESDLKNRKFVLVFEEGTDIKAILNQSSVANELLSIGYQVDAIADNNFAMQQKVPVKNEEPLLGTNEAENSKTYKGKPESTAEKLSKKAAKKASEKASPPPSEPSEKNKLNIESIEANSDAATHKLSPPKIVTIAANRKLAAACATKYSKKQTLAAMLWTLATEVMKKTAKISTTQCLTETTN